ncbi:hypothetical protein F7725_011221 [Dissostichus mawsoni]|uniref:Uncharacterized protein n=1 Tax=Dissostichus mawsoni TaxID=36200 RepID=A0A7J5Z8T1_DISMA|nr:hypothetical protein F7725_011221 [Dissostichus mawsoni]
MGSIWLTSIEAAGGETGVAASLVGICCSRDAGLCTWLVVLIRWSGSSGLAGWGLRLSLRRGTFGGTSKHVLQTPPLLIQTLLVLVHGPRGLSEPLQVLLVVFLQLIQRSPVLVQLPLPHQAVLLPLSQQSLQTLDLNPLPLHVLLPALLHLSMMDLLLLQVGPFLLLLLQVALLLLLQQHAAVVMGWLLALRVESVQQLNLAVLVGDDCLHQRPVFLQQILSAENSSVLHTALRFWLQALPDVSETSVFLKFTDLGVHLGNVVFDQRQTLNQRLVLFCTLVLVRFEAVKEVLVEVEQHFHSREEPLQPGLLDLRRLPHLVQGLQVVLVHSHAPRLRLQALEVVLQLASQQSIMGIW